MQRCLRGLFLVALSPIVTHAQPSSEKGKEVLIVSVVLAAETTERPAVEVLLRPKPSTENVVLLNVSEGGGVELEAALRTVRAARRRFGDSLSMPLRVVPKKESLLQIAKSGDVQRSQTVSRLRSFMPVETKEFGRVRRMTVVIPKYLSDR